MRADVLVVGSGASGAAAALAAARAGARTVVVRRGHGGTALASGAVKLELAGWLPGPPMAPAEVQALLSELLPLAPLGGREELLTVLGTVVRADMAFSTQARGALGALRGRRLAVVGVRGLGEVRAAPVVRAARAAGIEAEEVQLAFPEARHARDLSTPELARLADDPAVARALAAALAAAAEGFEALALPPVAGLDRWPELAASLDGALGDRWFELVPALPSVVGLRMQAALDERLAEAGVALVHGRVQAYALEDGRLRAVRAGQGEGEVTIEPHEVVLATGGLVGRGLRLRGTTLVEAVLGLPVRPAGSRPAGPAPDLPFGAGLGLDASFRPLDAQGRVAIANVRAAGELAGLAFSEGWGGLAASVSTGWSAGLEAARSASSASGRELLSPSFVAVAPDADGSGCLNCGLCLALCPAVRALSREKESYPGPRGMMSGLTRFETELDEVSDELSTCTLCGACASVCPGGVPVPEAIVRARSLLVRLEPDAGPAAYRAMRSAFERPGRLFEAEPLPGPRLDRADDVLFVGCSLPYYERDHALSTMRLLDALGVRYTLVDEVCCGGPLEVIGADRTPELARHNVAELRRVGARRVITCCPRCAATMVEEPAYSGLEIVHTTSLLAELLPGSEVAGRLRERLAGRAVTFHDPCERARLAGEVEAARTAMAAVGLELREMPRSGTFTECCGAGGGVRAAQTKTSLRMARLRVADAVETGAPVLLTECPSCLHNLWNGRKRSQKIDIHNLSSYLGAEL